MEISGTGNNPLNIKDLQVDPDNEKETGEQNGGAGGGAFPTDVARGGAGGGTFPTQDAAVARGGAGGGTFPGETQKSNTLQDDVVILSEESKTQSNQE